MLTMVQNTPNNNIGYIKCGEIFQSKQSYQDPYILRCIQCQEIYLLLESFIRHFEEDCKKAGATKKRKCRSDSFEDSTTEDEMDCEQQEVEKSSDKLQTNKDAHMEDPLIVKKEKNCRKSFDTEVPKIQENNTALEYCTAPQYRTQDEDEGGTTVNSQDENESNETESEHKSYTSHLEKRIKISTTTNINTSQNSYVTSIQPSERNQIRVATDLKINSPLPPQPKQIQEHPAYIQNPTEYLHGQPHVKNEPNIEIDVESMLQSGTAFQMNFQMPPEDMQKPFYMENNQAHSRNYVATDVSNMFQMEFGAPPEYYQGQQQMPFDQLYGKNYKGDICINSPSNSNSASSAFVSSFMKFQKNVTVLIAAYKEQPLLWNKNMPQYGNKLKRRELMEQIAQDLSKKHKLNINGSQVSAVVVHLYRKFQEDLQRVQDNEDNEDKTKKQYYTTPWFLNQLEFIKPYLENYSLEILDVKLPNLLPEQIVKVLEIYRGFTHLWNSNLIEHHCKNKRQETLNDMLKALETDMNLIITDKILDEYLRTIHNYFSREKRKILNSKKDKSNSTESLSAAAPSNKNDYYERLMFLNDHVRPFRCSECGGEYINPLHFKMHKSNHDGTVPFSCSQCNKTFKRVNVYIAHAKRHLEDLNYVCKECGKKFITFTNLRLHMRIHTGDKPYCCEMCGESFRFLQTLSNHRRRHEKRYLHSCKICSKGFYSKIRHDDHMNSHMNIRSYICAICNKAFITKRALQQHKVVHEDIRKHACKLCGKTFKHRAGVNQHMKTHDIATGDNNKSIL